MSITLSRNKTILSHLYFFFQISDNVKHVNLLNFSSNKVNNHTQAKTICKELNEWIKQEANLASNLAIPQLKELLVKSKRPLRRSSLFSISKKVSPRTNVRRTKSRSDSLSSCFGLLFIIFL